MPGDDTTGASLLRPQLPGPDLVVQEHRAPPAPLEASAGFPPAASGRRHRFAGIRDTRNRLAISPSPASASISSAAASRTSSRRALSSAVSPPQSGYLMTPAYQSRQPPPGCLTSALKDR